MDGSPVVSARRGDNAPGGFLLRGRSGLTSRRRGALPEAQALAGQPRPLPTDVQLALYRLAQEALNNVSKHAQARQAEVRLVWAPDHVCLEISDDGRGFDTRAIPPGHLGIGFMHERAATVGAALCIASRPQRGTMVTVRVDLTVR